MNGLTQGVHHRAIGFRERYAGVVREESPLPGGHHARTPEGREVPAQVGLIELQDALKITDAQGLLMEQVEDTEPIRVCKGLQHV